VLSNYNNGLDYFGKTSVFAPIVSLNIHLNFLRGSLDTLKIIEDKAKPYFDSLREERNATNDLQAAVGMTEKALEFLNARIGKITTDLYGEFGVWHKIHKLDSQMGSKKEELKKTLDTLKQQVTDAFGLSVDTFFNCLSQLSFMNVHEPASALAMGVSQIGTMSREAITKVLNKHGEPTSKSWLLDQIEVIDEEADLRSEFEHRADGSLS
jgi:hypothetical protein